MQSEVKESNQTVSVPLTSNHREAGKRGELRFIGAGACALWSISAVLLFQLAYDFSRLGFLILLYPVCLLQLTRASTVRQSFYFGLAVAMVSAAIADSRVLDRFVCVTLTGMPYSIRRRRGRAAYSFPMDRIGVFPK